MMTLADKLLQELEEIKEGLESGKELLHGFVFTLLLSDPEDEFDAEHHTITVRSRVGGCTSCCLRALEITEEEMTQKADYDYTKVH